MQRHAKAHLEVHHVWMPQDDVVLNLEMDVLDQHLLAAQDRFNGDVGAGSQVAAVVHLPEGACASMEAVNRADIKAVSLRCQRRRVLHQTGAGRGSARTFGQRSHSLISRVTL